MKTIETTHREALDSLACMTRRYAGFNHAMAGHKPQSQDSDYLHGYRLATSAKGGAS